MSKIQTFRGWLEAVTTRVDPRVNTGLGNTTAIDPNLTTVQYNPQQSATTGIGSGTTVPGNKSNNSGINGEIDRDISSAASNLKQIHGQLRDIFASVRSKSNAWRYPQMRTSFEKELISGVDGVGRAHAILLPVAKGVQVEQ